MVLDAYPLGLRISTCASERHRVAFVLRENLTLRIVVHVVMLQLGDRGRVPSVPGG